MPSDTVDLTPEQAKGLQDSLIDAYSQPEFQQLLHLKFKDVAGEPRRESSARAEVCLPIQIPVISKYGFSPDQKGVAASLAAFAKPTLRTAEIQQRNERLNYLVNPLQQDMSFLKNMGVTVSPLIDTQEPAPPKTAGGVVDLTVEQAREIQDTLIKAYSQPEFQQRLHRLFTEAAGDTMKEMSARSEVCLPIQVAVLPKFGFSADRQGVSASLKSFQKAELQTAELGQQAKRLAFLVNPSQQDKEFLEEVGVTQSPLLQKPSTEEIVLTVEQAIEIQKSLIQSYESPNFQSNLHSSFANIVDEPQEESRVRADLCLPLQLPVVSKYGFTPDKNGVAASVRAFTTPDLLANNEVQKLGEVLSRLVNPIKQDIAWVKSLGITQSPLFREPVSIFCLVQITGLTQAVEPSQAVLEMTNVGQPVEANGQKGWTVAWIEEEQGFIVQTFRGEYVCLPEENLRIYIPPDPESGGFDVAWPPDETSLLMSFSENITESLVSRSFSVIQMIHTEAQKSGVSAEVDQFEHWTVVAPEFQNKFMGLNPVGKIRWLRGDECEDPNCWIGSADSVLNVLADTLGPIFPEFGFMTGGRSKTMLHKMDPVEGAGDSQLALDRVMNGDELGNMLKFVHRSTFAMIYFLQGDGGFLAVEYLDGQTPRVNIPIHAGRVVLINQEVASFAFYPSSECLTVQSWILREELPGEVAVRPDYVLDGWDASRFPASPAYGASGETVDCMSLVPGNPGLIRKAEDYWAALQGGADLIIDTPLQRWDSDLHFDPTAGSGKMYTNHFGILIDFLHFDNIFFGISEECACAIDPLARRSLESGYSALACAGWNKNSLNNAEILVCYGTAYNDYGPTIFARGETTEKPSPLSLWNHRTDVVNNRLAWMFGLRGPTMNLDTACSASLSATAYAHSNMRPQEPNSMWGSGKRQIKCALVQGFSAIFDPLFSTQLCGAGMLSHQGRCFTFDQSADGFCRSEGASAMYYEVHNKETLTRYAILMGSNMNQDGRSASLSAPNGPSQQECIRGSLREANITTLDIHMNELHGTGTALGDPIEIGGLRATMMKVAGKVREHPLVKTSSKSNMAHGEGNAGITGIMKCMLMGCYAVAAPGCHLRLYNSHIEYNGYPVIFNPESIDQNCEWGYCGVSSFGFSGCNARGDVYCAATNGHRRTLPLGNDLTAGRHLSLMPKIEHPSVTTMMDRKEGDDDFSSDWAGFFQAGNPINVGTTFQLSGSWSCFQDMEAMVMKDGAYQWYFIMGDTLVEEFRIHTDYFFDSIICPATKKAGKDAIILGPGTAPNGYTWRIDGRSDGAEAGDLYSVKFSWDEQRREKKVEWEIVRGEARAEIACEYDIPAYEHRYFVRGTWTAWTCMELSPVLGLGHIHETTFRIGINEHEDFYLVRDRCEDQQIYPAINTIKDTKVKVRGPDGNGRKRVWRVQGSCGDQITLRLRVRNGEISVSVISSTSKELTWSRAAPGMDDVYFVDGSWLSSGERLQMRPHGSKPNVFIADLKISHRGCESFRILLDDDSEQAFYPAMSGAQSGQAIAFGPDNMGSGLSWNIIGEPREAVRIILNLAEADKRQRVTWVSL